MLAGQRAMTDELSPRQKQARDFVARYIAQHGRAPTYREIGKHLGYSRPAAGATQNLCARVIEKGALVRVRDCYRNLRLPEARA